MTDPLREMFGLPVETHANVCPGEFRVQRPATGADLALQWLGRGLRAAGGARVRERQAALDAHVNRVLSISKRRTGIRRVRWDEQLSRSGYAVLENLRQRGVKFCTGQVGDTLTVEVVLHG